MVTYYSKSCTVIDCCEPQFVRMAPLRLLCDSMHVELSHAPGELLLDPAQPHRWTNFGRPDSSAPATWQRQMANQKTGWRMINVKKP